MICIALGPTRLIVIELILVSLGALINVFNYVEWASSFGCNPYRVTWRFECPIIPAGSIVY